MDEMRRRAPNLGRSVTGVIEGAALLLGRLRVQHQAGRLAEEGWAREDSTADRRHGANQ